MTIIEFFDQECWRRSEEPDKWSITTDNFEGCLTTDSYYRTLELQGLQSQSIGVQFGYRTSENGDLAIA
jgi:hypothetical protein